VDGSIVLSRPAQLLAAQLLAARLLPAQLLPAQLLAARLLWSNLSTTYCVMMHIKCCNIMDQSLYLDCQQPKGLSMSYIFYADAGHGWLEVPLEDCKAIGLNLTDFTQYSYREAGTLYLEEDCDQARFVNAYKAVNGAMPEISYFEDVGKRYMQDSPIRKMERI